MLQLAGGVCLGVDVADLLELERALESERIVEVAADEEDRIVVEILGSVLGDGLAALAREELLHLLRQLLKLCDRLVVLLLFHRAERLAKRKADHVEHCELRGVGLRRRDGDLRAGPGVEHIVRLARDGRADHVDDGEDVRAALFRLAQRRHGVERFARLADDDDKRSVVYNRVAVPELGG